MHQVENLYIFCDTMAGTRHQTDIWLVGQPLPSLIVSKLPTKREILRRFFYNHNEGKGKLRDSANLTIEEALSFWEKCGVPLSLKKNAVDSLLALHVHWLGLKKSKSRSGDVYQQARNDFQASLDKTYDLAHVDVVNIMEGKIKKCTNDKDKAAMIEDLKFYQQQVETRVGSMLSKDTNVIKKSKKEERAIVKKKELKRKFEAEKEKDIIATRKVTWSTVQEELFSDESMDECVSPGNDKEFDINHLEKRKKKTDVVTPTLLSSLDRNFLTDRRATRTIKETAEALGNETATMNMSRSTLRRKRQENRKNVIDQFSVNFCPTGPIIVHWDGKLLPNEAGE